jgi:hypothetical protein
MSAIGVALSLIGVVLSGFFIWLGIGLIFLDDYDLGGSRLGGFLLVVFVPVGLLCVRALRRRLRKGES